MEELERIKSENENWNLLILKEDNTIGVLILEEYKNYFSINFAGIIPKEKRKGYSQELLKIAENAFFSKNSDKK